MAAVNATTVKNTSRSRTLYRQGFKMCDTAYSEIDTTHATQATSNNSALIRKSSNIQVANLNLVDRRSDFVYLVRG